MVKNKIIISAINLFEGGPLSVLNDCVIELLALRNINSYNVQILINNKELISKISLPQNFSISEFPLSRKSYLFRLFYEYIYFYFYSKKIGVYLWISLHDITPNVIAEKKAVYCHNISAFLKPKLRYLQFQPKIFFFSIFYKYLYAINIQKNNFVIVQQDWIKRKFCEMYNLNPSNVIVSNPSFKIDHSKLNFSNPSFIAQSELTSFFYPTLPRVFKNIEIICEACKILIDQNEFNSIVYISISKDENVYSRFIFDKYSNLSNIKFVGRLNREEVFQYYYDVDCLIFPSLLESWGLPITEFKSFDKQIIVSDLPYAYETINKYEKVSFFDPNDSFQLAKLMKEFIDNKQIKNNKNYIYSNSKVNSDSWGKLFNIIINNNE